MKKVRNIAGKLFNIIAFVLLVFSIINGFYLSLNPEIQVKYFSWYNKYYAWVNAIWAGGLGLGLVAVLKVLDKVKDDTTDTTSTLKKEYIEVANLLKKVNANDDKLEKVLKDILLEQKRDNELAKAELESRLENPYLKEQARDIINKVLEGGENENKD